MKKIIKILIIISILLISWFSITQAEENNSTYESKLDINANWWTVERVSENDIRATPKWWWSHWSNNELLNDFKRGGDWLFNTWQTWEKWVRNMVLNIAKNVKDLFLVIAWIYFLIIVLRLLFTESAEEEFEKFKKWLRWIKTGIIHMQISYSFVTTIYDKKVDWKLAWSIIENIIEPIVSLLETAASFIFIAIAIFAFFRIVSANWDEEKAKKWKLSVAYAIVWFVVIKVSSFLVNWVYSKTLCDWNNWVSCNAVEVKETAWVMFDVINWVNGFVWIVVVIMIIYTGFQIIFSAWDDEKIKKSKKSILYIIVWIIILTMNYILLTFFMTDNILTSKINNLI